MLGLPDIVLVVLEMVLESTATSEESVSPRVIAYQLESHLRTPSPFPTGTPRSNPSPTTGWGFVRLERQQAPAELR